jgi:hypothetical protein
MHSCVQAEVIAILRFDLGFELLALVLTDLRETAFVE